ncbi:MAG TPA: hypothetical protein VFV75_10480 [Candidatus Polarisedimenticolaceae bacterium]|nr:hypothetical protein [Candidatus Polarisedimenticolaceae bacterium]
MVRMWLAPLALAAAAAAGTAALDDGKLDPQWFGGPGVEFRETGDVDYVWMKPGFKSEGQSFWIKPWDEPAWLGKQRDTVDAQRAEELTKAMHGRFKAALATSLRGKAEVSLYRGNVVVLGRLVDVNTTKAAKFSGSATWDIKFVDAKSGELLMAVHHRTINANFMSDLPSRIWKWMGAFGDDMRYDFPDYAKGKPRHT